MNLNLKKILILICSAVLMGCMFLVTAFGATKSSDYKKYTVNSIKVVYTGGTGQVKVTWSDSRTICEKHVTLYRDGNAIDTITTSRTSWDVTDLVDSEGSYSASVYPTKLGSGYTKSSSKLKIDEKKLEKIEEFDSGEYYIDGVEMLYDDTTGKIYANWEPIKGIHSYTLQLLKGSSVVQKWKTTTAPGYDFTEVVSKKGTGNYTIEFYTTTIGDCYAVASDEFEVTSDMIKKIKARAKEIETQRESQRSGWYQSGPSQYWYYYKQPGVKAKKEFLTINGETYYFTSTGLMQTGWQAINGKWYYFSSTGAMLRDTTTPDGYKVNAAGEMVDANGQVASSKGQKSTPAYKTTLTKASIKVTESGKTPGVVKNAEFKASTGFTIKSTSLSKDYSQWKAGEAVEVVLVVEASANYEFSSGITFSATNCKSVSSTGDSKTRTVKMSYYPRLQLSAPSLVYVDSSDTLHWNKVTNASQYKVTLVNVDEEGSKTTTTLTLDEPSTEIGQYLNEYSGSTSVKIYSMQTKKKSSYFTNSTAFEIKDLTAWAQENTIDGTMEWTNAGLRYYDSDGEKASGWRNILGGWYHFRKNGYATDPGWFKDTDGNWYYFDSSYRMCTGTINDGTANYFLNDGSNPNVPYGAWVQ